MWIQHNPPNPVQELSEGVPLQSACVLVEAVRGVKTTSQGSACSCRAVILPGSWGHGGTAPMIPMTEVLQWKNMSFYEGQGEEGELPIIV